MAYVRLGTTTNQNIIEFLVFNDDDKQCATIYYAKSPINNGHYKALETEIIGKLPEHIEANLQKLRIIASTALEKD